MKLLLAAALSLCSTAASAAPHGIYRPGRVSPIHPTGGKNLQYYGGPVISSAKVYVVYWGEGVDKDFQAKLPPFYVNMLDSTYMDWLSIYDTNLNAVDGRQGTGQHIGRGAYLGAVTIKPGTSEKNLTDAMVQKELEAQVAKGALAKPDDNTLYMLYFPKGYSITIEGMRSCSSFCAYHEGFKSGSLGTNVFYGIMPACAATCGFGSSPFDSLSAVSSHEAIEAITDPFPTPGSHPAYPQAWNDPNGEEISDLCSEGASTVTGHGNVSKVTWNWDNRITGCNQGPWQQFAAPVSRPALDALHLKPEAIFKGF